MKKVYLVILLILVLGAGLVWFGCSNEPANVTGPGSESQQIAKLTPGAPGIERAMAVQNEHSRSLMAISGVVGTATGLGADGKPAVIVLTKAQGISGIPGRLDGITVIVKVTGEIRALKKPSSPPGKDKPSKGGEVDPKSRFDRPVPIGVSTGNEGSCSSGTIACRVRRVINGKDVFYALSNNHVYALKNAAPIGSEILQPGRYDTECIIDQNNIIGTLFDFEPIVFSTVVDNTIDAAIALSSTADLGNATPSNGYGTPKSATIEASVGQKVQKYGRTSALTKGQVTMINAAVYIGYSSGTTLFVDQIIVEARKPFIKGGDSGSLLVTDPGRRPVGLLFAGNGSGKLAIANPIDLVLDRFGVTIDGE